MKPGKAYYSDGFRRMVGGVPCKVASKLKDGRYIRKPEPTTEE